MAWKERFDLDMLLNRAAEVLPRSHISGITGITEAQVPVPKPGRRPGLADLQKFLKFLIRQGRDQIPALSVGKLDIGLHSVHRDSRRDRVLPKILGRTEAHVSNVRNRVIWPETVHTEAQGEVYVERLVPVGAEGECRQTQQSLRTVGSVKYMKFREEGHRDQDFLVQKRGHQDKKLGGKKTQADCLRELRKVGRDPLHLEETRRTSPGLLQYRRYWRMPGVQQMRRRTAEGMVPNRLREARSTGGSVFWHLSRDPFFRFVSVSPMTGPGLYTLISQLDQNQ
jgi:hypothetical protein